MVIAHTRTEDRDMLVSAWVAAVALVVWGSNGPECVLGLRNPGFEEMLADGSPAAWTLVPRSDPASIVSWKRLETEAHGAGASVSGGIETRADGAVWLQAGVAVPEGTKYLRVTAWIKAEDVRSSAGAVAVHFHDASGASLQESVAVAAGTPCDWSRYVGHVAVPDGTVTVSVHCFVGYAFARCGRFWWDDLELRAVDAPVEPVTAHVDKPFEWEERMAENKRLLELLKSIPGVRTEGDDCRHAWLRFNLLTGQNVNILEPSSSDHWERVDRTERSLAIGSMSYVVRIAISCLEKEGRHDDVASPTVVGAAGPAADGSLISYRTSQFDVAATPHNRWAERE